MKDNEKTKATFTIDKHMLELAKTIFTELGLSLDTGIAVYLYQVVYTRSIPFAIKLPPEEVLERVDLYKKLMKGMDEVKAGRIIPGEVVFEELKKKYGGENMRGLTIEKQNELEAFVDYLDEINHQFGEGAKVKSNSEVEFKIGERVLSLPLTNETFGVLFDAVYKLLHG